MSPFLTITPQFSVSPQLAVDDMARAKAEGYRIIICNRPDGETPDQPTIAIMEAAAGAEGLAFHAIPVGPAGIAQEDITQTLSLMASGEPVLAYCRSGTRSSIVHALARVQAGDPIATVIKDAGAVGYDLTPYRERFEVMADGA